MAPTHALAAAKLFSRAGTVAVVTGGGSGIGLMCAQALAQNGAKVYITGRTLEKLETSVKHHAPEDEPGQLIPLQMDVTDKESIRKVVAEITSKEKAVHTLINNAGIASGKSGIEHDDPKELSKALFEDVEFSLWDDVYRTNVSANYFVASAFLPLLAAASKESPEAASIINISSISGKISFTQGGQFAYNSSKAATVQLTSLMAHEFSRPSLRIRVNSIAPGYFPSEMTTSESDHKNKSEIPDKGPEYRESKHVPAERAGADEDMASLCLMLASNRYIQGQTVVIDGGLMTQMPS